MILVSVNTRDGICEITLAHKVTSINYCLKLNSSKHLNPAIFYYLLKGFTLLIKKIISYRIHSVI